MKSNFNLKSVIAIVLVLVFLGTYVISFLNTKKLSDHPAETPRSVIKNDTAAGSSTSPALREPQFVKQSKLNFLNRDRKQIKKIDIEIADNDQKREQGLMYRKSM